MARHKTGNGTAATGRLAQRRPANHSVGHMQSSSSQCVAEAIADAGAPAPGSIAQAANNSASGVTSTPMMGMAYAFASGDTKEISLKSIAKGGNKARVTSN